MCSRRRRQDRWVDAQGYVDNENKVEEPVEDEEMEGLLELDSNEFKPVDFKDFSGRTEHGTVYGTDDWGHPLMWDGDWE